MRSWLKATIHSLNNNSSNGCSPHILKNVLVFTYGSQKEAPFSWFLEIRLFAKQTCHLRCGSFMLCTRKKGVQTLNLYNVALRQQYCPYGPTEQGLSPRLNPWPSGNVRMSIIHIVWILLGVIAEFQPTSNGFFFSMTILNVVLLWWNKTSENFFWHFVWTVN